MFRLTGQDTPGPAALRRIESRFRANGLAVQQEVVEVRDSQVLVLIAERM